MPLGRYGDHNPGFAVAVADMGLEGKLPETFSEAAGTRGYPSAATLYVIRAVDTIKSAATRAIT